MSAPVIKGWCPGAHRPMRSGDGLVVRIRPFLSRLTRAQVLTLCELADTYGNGVLDLTSRANLQIRGVQDQAHEDLLRELNAVELLDKDPLLEGRRNILMTPDWTSGDLAHRLATQLLDALPEFPDLPQKMGFAIDTGAAPYLADASADFRIELDEEDQLVLRLDGLLRGRRISEQTAIGSLLDAANWFVASGGLAFGRMRRFVSSADVPQNWGSASARAMSAPVPVGPFSGGTCLGAPFGKIETGALRTLIREHGIEEIRLLPDRTIYVPNVAIPEAHGFETTPSRLMNVHACPGAPYCPQASVQTMDLARTLAQHVDGPLHISGCAKGCAFQKPARVTLVGCGGRFDLVSDGRAWDEPRQRGIDPAYVSEMVAQI